MDKDKLKRLFNYLIAVFKHNSYWIGFSFFTYYLTYFLYSQRMAFKNTQIEKVPLEIFDNDFALGLVVVVATYTLIVSLSNTNDRKARGIMFASQTFIIIFLTIGHMEFNLATHDVSIGTGALLFIIYLTISTVLKRG